MLHGTTKGKAPSNEIKIIVILLNGLLQLHGLFICLRISKERSCTSYGERRRKLK